jgi:hypothetical protein
VTVFFVHDCVTEPYTSTDVWCSMSRLGCSCGWFSENEKPAATVVFALFRSREMEARPVVAV